MREVNEKSPSREKVKRENCGVKKKNYARQRDFQMLKLRKTPIVWGPYYSIHLTKECF